MSESTTIISNASASNNKIQEANLQLNIDCHLILPCIDTKRKNNARMINAIGVNEKIVIALLIKQVKET